MSSTDDLPAVVREAIKVAIERAGKAQALALRVESLLHRPYNHRTVSAWARGDAMPPGDALLAAAKSTGVSLDAVLGIGREPSVMERRIDELRQEVEHLRQEQESQGVQQAEMMRILMDRGLWDERGEGRLKDASSG